MNRPLLVLAVIVAAFCLSWIGIQQKQPPANTFMDGIQGPSQSELIERFGGSAAMDVVQYATRIQAFRLDKNSQDLETRNFARGPVEVSPKLAADVAGLITKSTSYLGGGKLCTPFYGVRISFHRGDETVDVSFCFQCKILSVVYNGRSTGGGNFDPINRTLVGQMKSIFPDDAEIQGLGDAIGY